MSVFATRGPIITPEQLLEHRRLSEQHRHAISEQKLLLDARKTELAPLVGGLVLEAKNTYAALRPKAQPISEIATAFPLRYQLDAAHCLMIRMRDNSEITIKQPQSYDGVLWSLDHDRLLTPQTSDHTRIEELGEWDESALGLRTGIYEYPTTGSSPVVREEPCSYFNGYAGAEERIAAISADLKTAVEQYS